MRFFKRLACKALGHKPIYSQARVMIDGHWLWLNQDRCTRCGSCKSRKIHTPGFLEFPVWFAIASDALRSSQIDLYRRKRRHQPARSPRHENSGDDCHRR